MMVLAVELVIYKGGFYDKEEKKNKETKSYGLVHIEYTVSLR